MKTQFLNSLKIFFFFTLFFGFAYPISVTLIAQLFYPKQANGSLIIKNNTLIGSELIAQKTISNHYFWPRPSASDYGAIPSGASNLSLTSKKLREAVQQRESQGGRHELLFASASGLDPHISSYAAASQLPRIFFARKLDEVQQKQVLELIKTFTEKRQFGFLGAERINVLKLNLALDSLFKREIGN
jgi:potassium-transporting ATPase KdpC subunit